MFGNFWHKKEKPLAGFAGFGGGVTSLATKSGGVGKFTLAPSPSPGSTTDYVITDGYSSPVVVGPTGGHRLAMVITSGPFIATIKLWGAGGGCGINGGTAGSGGYATGEFEFIEGETYYWTVGEGGRQGNQGGTAIGGGGAGAGSPGPQGSGGGGGGYTALFKAPPGNSHPTATTQAYCVLCVGGGGGSGQGGNSASYHEPNRGGSGGGVYPPAASPFATNFGGGRGTNPTAPGPGTVVGQYAAGPGNQGGGAPYYQQGSPTNDGDPAGGYGGERQSGNGGFGYAFQGGTYSSGGGGGGGGGGYWGGGSGANPTGRLYGGGGGGGGFMTVPTVHPEGIGCTGVTGMNSRQNSDPSPYTVVANQSDPDWGGAGQGAQYKYPEGWSEANACGASGRIVIKAPA